MTKTAAVIGAGPAGLFCAWALVDAGYQVALFESHSKPGGCASFFRRRFERSGAPVTKRPPQDGDTFALFDAGATVLNGMRKQANEQQLLARLLDRWHVKLDAQYSDLPSIHMKLPNEPVVALPCKTYAQYLESLRRNFASDRPLIDSYLVRLAECAELLALSFEKIPHLPVEGLWDLRQNLALWPEISKVIPEFLLGYAHSFGEELDRRGVSQRLRRWIEMNLLITLQCRPEEAHPLYGALALFFYPMGSGTLTGGMKSLFLPLLERLKTQESARVYMRTPVSKIESSADGKYLVKTANAGDFGPFDAVFSSLPRFDSQNLTQETLIASDEELESLEEKLWSAWVGYLVVEDHAKFPDGAFHVHSSDAPGDAYMSFSRRGDTLRTPEGTRSLTLSAHIPLTEARKYLGKDFSKEAKAEIGREQLRSHLLTTYPEAKILFEEYASPRTFVRYTRRSHGTVGGIPLSLKHAFQNAPSQRSHQKDFFLIGDTSFPGQSIYACAVGAVAAVEKFTGRRFKI